MLKERNESAKERTDERRHQETFPGTEDLEHLEVTKSTSLAEKNQKANTEVKAHSA